MRTYKKYLYIVPISSGPDSGERITPSDHLPCAVLASYWSPDPTLACDWPRQPSESGHCLSSPLTVEVKHEIHNCGQCSKKYLIHSMNCHFSLIMDLFEIFR